MLTRRNATPDLVRTRIAGCAAAIPLFLAGKNANAASRAIKAIRTGVNILAQHPEIGFPVEDREPEYREWLIDFGDNGYIALYRYDGETALIVPVRHQLEAGYS